MNIEFIGEKIFYAEIDKSAQIWVAKGLYNNIHFLDSSGAGVSLPVWSTSERVTEYLDHARLIGPKYTPFAVSLKTFTQTWLADPSMAISELLINPDGKSSRMLAMTKEEFLTAQSQEY